MKTVPVYEEIIAVLDEDRSILDKEGCHRLIQELAESRRRAFGQDCTASSGGFNRKDRESSHRRGDGGPRERRSDPENPEGHRIYTTSCHPRLDREGPEPIQKPDPLLRGNDDFLSESSFMDGLEGETKVIYENQVP